MRMVSSRSYFARMNENRGDNIWLTEDQLFEGTKEILQVKMTILT